LLKMRIVNSSNKEGRLDPAASPPGDALRVHGVAA
jgi:hypothetical protein